LYLLQAGRLPPLGLSGYLLASVFLLTACHY